MSSKPLDTAALSERVRKGDPRAVARALSVVENGEPSAPELLHAVFDPSFRSHTIGITGNAGAGKSTMVDAMIPVWRSRGRRVGILAVDPSSPFSGGAILGDRLRMQRHATDEGVFIRSMGNRGHTGGLAGCSRDAAQILMAAGYNPVVLETLGVGQAEVDVALIADMTLIVKVPGLGDEVQLLKAGITEIGDIIVLNKADKPGIDHLETIVRASLESLPPGSTAPPVVRTVSTTGEGIEELVDLMDELFSTRHETPQGIRRKAALTLRRVVDEKGRQLSRMLFESSFDRASVIDGIVAGETSPWEIGEELLAHARRLLDKERCKDDPGD